MSLNEALIVPVAPWWRYDGTNGAELVAQMEHALDGNGAELTINIDFEEGGVLALSGFGGYKNVISHSIEIQEWTGPTEVHEGDFVRGGLGISMRVQHISAGQIGIEYAIVEAQP